MKIFRWLLVLSAAAAVAALDWYLEEALHVQYGEWRYSFSAFRAALAVVALVAALQIAFKLLGAVFFFPSRLSHWRRERASKQRREFLEAGVRAQALGDDKQALKSFSSLSAAGDAEGVYAWLAARAAEELGDLPKRDEWLRRAATDSSADIAAAAKARLACEDNRMSEAFNILSAAGAPSGSPLLARIYLDIAQRRGQWPQALAAAYRLRPSVRPPERTAAAADIIRAGLSQTGELAALKEFWKGVSAEDQKTPALLAEYLYALHRLGDGKAAADALERAVKTAPGAPEILAAAAAFGGQNICENIFAGGQNRADDKNPEYLSAMGALAARLELWGKARRYYQMANSLRPDPRAAKALAAVEEKMQADAPEKKDNFSRP
ncbi:MAG: heme biosynthesis HemY N-terminal domain-containing protein [Gammaproteobacteria bacterium]